MPYVQKFKRALGTLYWFFQASAVRTAALKAIQDLLNSPSLKMKEAKDVRWLSHDQAVQTLRRTLPAVLTALEREGSEKEEPVAIGLFKVMKSYEFVACLHLLCEILPHLSHLSRLFQAEYIQISTIRPYLSACIKAITTYKDRTKAPDVAATDSALADQLQPFNIPVSPQRKETFDKTVRQPFLGLLLHNLEDRFPKVELLSAFGIFDPRPTSCRTEEDREKAEAESQENLEILAFHYSTGDSAPVNAEELRKEWESFSVMLADYYASAKTRDVLRDLASV